METPQSCTYVQAQGADTPAAAANDPPPATRPTYVYISPYGKVVVHEDARDLLSYASGCCKAGDLITIVDPYTIVGSLK